MGAGRGLTRQGILPASKVEAQAQMWSPVACENFLGYFEEGS